MLELGYSEYGELLLLRVQDFAYRPISYPRRRLGLCGPCIMGSSLEFVPHDGIQVTRKIANVYGGKHSKAWHTNFGL